MPTADDDRLITGRLLLGARLRARRTEVRLQLTEVAERAGLSLAYLSDVERGRKLPTLATLDAIAVALETTAAALLSGLYPWATSEPPAEPPAAVPDGRAGRRMRRRTSSE